MITQHLKGQITLRTYHFYPSRCFVVLVESFRIMQQRTLKTSTDAWDHRLIIRELEAPGYQIQYQTMRSLFVYQTSHTKNYEAPTSSHYNGLKNCLILKTKQIIIITDNLFLQIEEVDYNHYQKIIRENTKGIT